MICTWHVGAAQHGDVAAVFDLLWLEAGVGREPVLEIELLHVRQVDHPQRVVLGLDAFGEHEILERSRDVEEDAFVGPILVEAERNRSNALVGVRLPITTTSLPSKPFSVATIVWSAPFGTVALPGFTSIRYGTAASTSF